MLRNALKVNNMLYISAICTFASSAMAGALMVGLTVYHFTKLWFLDGVVGFAILLFMFVYGARYENF